MGSGFEHPPAMSTDENRVGERRRADPRRLRDRRRELEQQWADTQDRRRPSSEQAQQDTGPENAKAEES
jgi:hypothetical protein